MSNFRRNMFHVLAIGTACSAAMTTAIALSPVARAFAPSTGDPAKKPPKAALPAARIRPSSPEQRVER